MNQPGGLNASCGAIAVGGRSAPRPHASFATRLGLAGTCPRLAIERRRAEEGKPFKLSDRVRTKAKRRIMARPCLHYRSLTKNRVRFSLRPSLMTPGLLALRKRSETTLADAESVRTA